MSANLLEGVTPTLKNGTTESDGVWHNAGRTIADSHSDWLVWDLAGQTALATNQTYHVGLSTKGAGANSASLRFAIGYKDAAGHTNWANSNPLPIGTSWGRAEATIVVPSGMTPFAFYVAAYGVCPETWMAAPTLSLGSPVTLASSAHTPYATQNHVSVTYATKSQLKVTDTELSGKVSDALTTARAYTDSSIETEVTNRNAAIKAQADSISLSVSKTYAKYETFSAYQTDADGRIATANSNASTAVSTAKTAAADAATAKTNASAAVSTANAAKSTAQTASTNASNAVSTANSANSKSDSAVSTANSASSTANAAKSTVDGMKLGGRNLLKGTSMDSKAVTTPTTANTTWGSGFAFPADAALHAVIPYGAEYRCSVDVLLPVDGIIVVDMNTYAESGTSWAGNDNDNMSRRTQNAFNVKANVWTRLSWGSENTNAANTGKQAIYINDSVGLLPQSAAVTWHYRGLKVELGNKATDWTPAPEDTDSAVADAKRAGTDAQTSANNAQKAADKAQASADDTAAALAKAAVRIRIDGTPMADGTSQLMAHVYVGNDEVPASAIAKLGTLVWKMDGVADRRGTTTYTAKTGKFVACRLEA